MATAATRQRVRPELGKDYRLVPSDVSNRPATYQLLDDKNCITLDAPGRDGVPAQIEYLSTAKMYLLRMRDAEGGTDGYFYSVPSGNLIYLVENKGEASKFLIQPVLASPDEEYLLIEYGIHDHQLWFLTWDSSTSKLIETTDSSKATTWCFEN